MVNPESTFKCPYTFIFNYFISANTFLQKFSQFL